LNDEQRDYTMLVPVNDCWDRLVDKFKGFYHYSEDEEPELADKYACRSILDALVFETRSQSSTSDYWESTSGKLFYRPQDAGGLFEGTEAIGCSNGQILKAADVNLSPYQVLNSDIVVEAENIGEYLLTANYYDENKDRPVFVAAANTGVSSSYYMKFTSTNMLRGATVTYAIPNVLSCAYDIGIVFVPMNLTRNGWSSSIDTKKGRVDVELNDKYTKEKLEVEGIEIPGDKVDTIWVARGHQFAYCDYFPDRVSMEDAKISLKIVSTPKRSESDYTRDLYIDCILLKPSIDGDLSDEE